MRSTRSIRRPSRSEGGHWLSFSDLMSCLLLIFILIMFYIMYQYFDMYEISMAEIARQQYDLEQANADLASQKEKLSEAESQMLAQQIKLNAAQADLTDAESILAAQQAELASAQSLLSEKETEIAAQQEKLDALSIQLGNQQTQINEQQAILAQQQATMDQQQLTLNLQQQTLDDQQQQIEELVGLKTRIITSLSEAFKSSNISAVVDPTNGSIALESDVLFSTGKYTLTDEGKEFINSFFPVYLKVLSSEEYRPYVAEIIIEGHTDSEGGHISNLKLSQQRALNVAAYILGDDYTAISTKQKRALQEVITANGRSEYDLVYDSNGREDKDASRRVVFKFRLTDEQMIQQLKSILEGSEMAADTAE